MAVTNKVYILLSVAISCLKECQGCFPLDDLFVFNRDWKQQTSLFNYTLMSVGREADDLMKLDYYHGQALQRTVTMRCLIAYGANRYLVRVESEFEEESLYTCVRFELLTNTIFHISQTVSDEIRKKVNCVDDDYSEDASIWFANMSYFGIDCPLTGGYQLVVNEDSAAATSANCIDSIYTYNPRFQFQCDNVKSGNVVLEMGDACLFHALVSKIMIVKRNIAFFRCMGHWAKGSTTSLLLQMQENEGQVWCLQFQPSPSYDGFLPMRLSLDGRCSKDHDITIASDTKGQQVINGALAQFFPPSDPKCKSQSNQTQCSEKNVCQESNQCPGQCNRCRKDEDSTPCTFDSKLRGRWKPLSSHLDYIYISVDVHSISGYYGEFTCRKHTGQDESKMLQLSLVQTGSVPSCMPFYACLVMRYMATGVLFFEFRSVMRQKTGAPFSCLEGSEQWGHLNLIKTESPLTLFDTSKLVRTSCNVDRRYSFPTVHHNCRLVVGNCSGTCTSLNAFLDAATCGNETVAKHPISSSHTCLGTVHFQDNVFGVVTTNQKSSRFSCWVFAGTRLFIAPPEDCNQKSVSLILHDVEALTTYDPLITLVEAVQDGAQETMFSLWLILLQYLLAHYFISI